MLLLWTVSIITYTHPSLQFSRHAICCKRKKSTDKISRRNFSNKKGGAIKSLNYTWSMIARVLMNAPSFGFRIRGKMLDCQRTTRININYNNNNNDNMIKKIIIAYFNNSGVNCGVIRVLNHNYINAKNLSIRRKQQKTCGCERVIKILLPGNSWYFFSGAAKQWIDLFSESKLTIKKWKKKWLCKCNYFLEQVYALNSCKYWGRESQNNYLAVKTSD